VGLADRVMARRSYGTGQLYVHTDAQVREIWYGRWYIGTKRIKRAIGPKRRPGTRDGLTRAQAEAELRRRMEATEAPTPERAPSMEEAGERLIRSFRGG
jgi:hypothetical protein